MATYNLVQADEIAASASILRRKRLNKPKNNWCLGMTMDLVLGAGPWVVGSAAVAAGLTAIYTEVEGASDTFALFNAPVAIGAIATFAGFLLVGKQGTNLGNNATIVGEFGNLSGSILNLALFIKSQISSGKSIEFLTLPDGSGGFYQTTRIGLVLSSLCYTVKYNGRGVAVDPFGLPIGQDTILTNSYIALTSPANGSPGMSNFAALVLMIGELVDNFQSTAGDRASEYSVLFGQLNAITAAEGAIMGTAGYGGPFLMKYLLYILYSLYLLLLLMTSLVPDNQWNSVWIIAILSFTTIAFYQISERYGNPMKLRSRSMGQTPFVSSTCVDTEIAVTAAFGRANSTTIGISSDTGSVAARGMTFKLGI